MVFECSGRRFYAIKEPRVRLVAHINKSGRKKENRFVEDNKDSCENWILFEEGCNWMYFENNGRKEYLRRDSFKSVLCNIFKRAKLSISNY